MVTDVIKRWLILGGLLVITLWLAWTMDEDDSELVVVKAIQPKKQLIKQEKVVIDDLFTLTKRTAINGTPVDIFGKKVKPVKKIVKRPPPPKPKPRIPKAPRLPFNYIGKLIENDVTKVFLMEGQALHIVSQGDKIGNAYILKSVGEQQISLLYLPLNTIQKINIGKAP